MFTNPPDAEDVGYDPWAFVEEAPGNVLEAYYGNRDVMTKLITVTLFQSPDSRGRTPPNTQIKRLFDKVSEAVHLVDEDVTPGVFISLQRQVEQPPVYDPKTKGLFCAVRFRMLYFRR